MIERTAFVWETALGSPERVQWLKENHTKPVTESEYIQHIKELPHNHKRAAACRNPSRNRKHYKYLKERFGFFGADK